MTTKEMSTLQQVILEHFVKKLQMKMVLWLPKELKSLIFSFCRPIMLFESFPFEFDTHKIQQQGKKLILSSDKNDFQYDTVGCSYGINPQIRCITDIEFSNSNLPCGKITII